MCVVATTAIPTAACDVDRRSCATTPLCQVVSHSLHLPAKVSHRVPHKDLSLATTIHNVYATVGTSGCHKDHHQWQSTPPPATTSSKRALPQGPTWTKPEHIKEDQHRPCGVQPPLDQDRTTARSPPCLSIQVGKHQGHVAKQRHGALLCAYEAARLCCPRWIRASTSTSIHQPPLRALAADP